MRASAPRPLAPWLWNATSSEEHPRPRPTVAREFEQELPAMAALRGVPDVAWQVVSMSARHQRPPEAGRFGPQNSRLRPLEESTLQDCQVLMQAYGGPTLPSRAGRGER